MPDEVRIRHSEAEFTVGTFANSLIWSFRGPVTLARLEHSVPVHQDLARRYKKFAIINLIGEEMPVHLADDAREFSARVTKEYQAYHCAIGEIIEGTGFRSAIVRSVTSGIRLVARSTCPSKVFGDTALAAAWFAPLMAAVVGAEPQIRALQEAMDRVRTWPDS